MSERRGRKRQELLLEGEFVVTVRHPGRYLGGN